MTQVRVDKNQLAVAKLLYSKSKIALERKLIKAQKMFNTN
jgi:hypothetical protein